MVQRYRSPFSSCTPRRRVSEIQQLCTTTQITRWRREEEEEEFVEKGRGVAASRSIDISRTSCRKTRTLYWSF
jgi:hypothetical protein